jgi:SSS family solute:Na+ symporter
MATGVVVFFGLLWIPIMKVISEGHAGLYDYLQNVQGFLAPPITAVFLLGLFSTRINDKGAFWGMVLGFIIGMFKLTVQTLVQSGALVGDGILHAIGAFNGYYFSGVLFLISIVIIVSVSLATPRQSAEQLKGLTFSSVTPEQKAENRASWGMKEVIGTAVVLGLVLAVYIYFSYWLG